MASHTSVSPPPAYRCAASGVNSPALPQAMALQPVVRTRTSFLISSLIMARWAASCCVLTLLHPTTPATPLILPLAILSLSGL
ncbi:MAG: hypothetical protein A4E61_01901 [Syntrophorhabdus sp. PtaB.Bin184]|nr:MAG: hypothetical protein A4E61_01901 [Syntrophorhabdus sp. PtaB.Bin184]